jgi:N-acetylglucosaminyldiphosphoundecaprenol N-acetyl-beta-D-mannosaminyltransferase
MIESQIPRVNVLGVGVSAINIPMALQTIDQWIQEHSQQYVCVTGVHGVIESQRAEDLRRIHNRAGMVTPDGMPLVWVSHLKGYPQVTRVYGPDLMLAICEHSVPKGYRHFFYGGADGVPERLVLNLTEWFHGLNVVGTYSPPFRPMNAEEEEQLLQLIEKARPDILWVGLSTPKQELWMADHIGKVNAPVLIGVGAAFDFHAGLKKQAPPWMQRNGLEWLFRLVTEPRRLWRRYLINNPLFIVMILAQFLGLKRYSLD